MKIETLTKHQSELISNIANFREGCELSLTIV